MTKKERRRFSRDGLPTDVGDWTEQDWKDFFKAIEKAKRRIAARHRQPQPNGEPCPTQPAPQPTKLT